MHFISRNIASGIIQFIHLCLKHLKIQSWRKIKSENLCCDKNVSKIIYWLVTPYKDKVFSMTDKSVFFTNFTLKMQLQCSFQIKSLICSPKETHLSLLSINNSMREELFKEELLSALHFFWRGCTSILTCRMTVLWHFGCSNCTDDVVLFTNAILPAADTDSPTKSWEQDLAFLTRALKFDWFINLSLCRYVRFAVYKLFWGLHQNLDFSPLSERFGF